CSSTPCARDKPVPAASSPCTCWCPAPGRCIAAINCLNASKPTSGQPFRTRRYSRIWNRSTIQLRSMIKSWIDDVYTVIGLILLALALLWFGQRGLIYFPDRPVPEPAALGLTTAEAVSFQTEDGLTLDGWFIPARGTATGYTVIVFNGNAGHRGH